MLLLAGWLAVAAPPRFGGLPASQRASRLIMMNTVAQQTMAS